MAFCTNCGAEVRGSFCVQCGSPAGSAGPAAGAQPAASVSGSRPPAPAAGAPPAAPISGSQPPAPAKKKSRLLVWVLVGVLTLVVLAGVAVVGVGFFVASKVKQAGFDPELMEKNPGLAMTKMIAAANPDIEVVKVDEGRGRITLREKSSGKVTTVDFEDVKQGRITFRQEGQEAVTLDTGGSGESGAFEIRSGDQSMRFAEGASAKRPDWLPTYPGAAPGEGFTRNIGGNEEGVFTFTTSDPPRKVFDFYRQALESAGMQITSEFDDSGAAPGGTLGGEDATRKVALMISTADGKTLTAVTFGTKK